MSRRPHIILYNSKARALGRRHPWVFSGAVRESEPGLCEGAIVDVFSEAGQYLATGHYSAGSIAVRIFSFEPVIDLRAMWEERLSEAFHLRRLIGLAACPETNAYRLINAEGDGLPGLVIDWYGDTAVFQAHSVGMYLERIRVVEALRKVYGPGLRAVFDRSASTLHGKGGKTGDGYLLGEACEGAFIRENGLKFRVDWEAGQKTGFFLDQRENRALLQRYAKEREVLNVFSYSGGFTVYAAAGGARSLSSLDSSESALHLARENVAMNNPEGIPHFVFQEDAFTFLGGMKHGAYDLMVLDPPAFSKGPSSRHSALQAYRRLNQVAIRKIRENGILFTFSCSQSVGPELFSGAVTAAAIETGRKIRVLHELSQPPDHPVSIYHPEGRYLKGLVLHVR